MSKGDLTAAQRLGKIMARIVGAARPRKAAPRFHSGGVVFRSDEVPAILHYHPNVLIGDVADLKRPPFRPHPACPALQPIEKAPDE